MRYFNGLATRQVENKVVNAQDIEPGDFVSGEEVEYVQVDIGMVIVYYRTGNYCFFNKYEKVSVLRGQNV